MRSILNRIQCYLICLMICFPSVVFAEEITSSVEEIVDKKIIPIRERLRKIEGSIIKNKLILPRIEIPYLYELIVNDDAIYSKVFTDKLLEKFEKKQEDYNLEAVKLFDFDAPDFRIIPKNKSDNSNEIKLYDNSPEILLSKLEAIEDLLNIDKKSKTLIERITIVHNTVNNGDFDSDHIRFGVLTSTTLLSGNSKFVTEAIVLNVYPAYSRFIPNTWDLYRRSSFMLGVGKVIYNDAQVEVSGVSFILGVGFDLVKGVALTAGFQRQLTKEATSENASFNSNAPFFIGVTLNKDFWKSLVDV